MENSNLSVFFAFYYEIAFHKSFLLCVLVFKNLYKNYPRYLNILYLGTVLFGWFLFILLRNLKQFRNHNMAAELFFPYFLLLIIFISTKLMPIINPWLLY